MKFGGAMFFTEYSMTAPELAVALEERGFDSVWAPEHSHIPVSRKTPFPGGGELAKAICRRDGPVRGSRRRRERDENDQARHGRIARAAARHDPDREACGIHRPSEPGPLPLRHRWRLEPGRDGEPRNGIQNPFKRVRESIEAMKEIWTKPKAEYHGEFVNFDPMMAWPKPVQKPHPPILSAGLSRMAQGGPSGMATAGFRRPEAI